MERMDRMMDEMMSKAFTMPRAQEGPLPFVYGFSMSVGSDGKPEVREFGNLEQSSRGPLLKEEREPLVDVMEDGDEIVVGIEIPGVEQLDVKLEASGRELQ